MPCTRSREISPSSWLLARPRARAQPIRPRAGEMVDLAQLDHWFKIAMRRSRLRQLARASGRIDINADKRLRDKPEDSASRRRKKRARSAHAGVGYAGGGDRTIRSKTNPRNRAKGADTGRGRRHRRGSADTGAKSADTGAKSRHRSEECDTGAKGADTARRTPTLRETRTLARRTRTTTTASNRTHRCQGAPLRPRQQGRMQPLAGRPVPPSRRHVAT